jgi:hypothetical protein
MTVRHLALWSEDALCSALGAALVAQSGVAVQIDMNNIAGGAGPFKAKIGAMNNIALKVMPVLMIADGDQANCVVKQRNAWFPLHPNPRLALRLAVREAESWVLADHEGFSDFANISRNTLPPDPENLPDPKQALLDFIKRCKRRDLRDEMLAARPGRALTGLGYNLHLADFVKNHWQAARAAPRAPSLARAIPRIAALLQM